MDLFPLAIPDGLLPPGVREGVSIELRRHDGDTRQGQDVFLSGGLVELVLEAGHMRVDVLVDQCGGRGDGAEEGLIVGNFDKRIAARKKHGVSRRNAGGFAVEIFVVGLSLLVAGIGSHGWRGQVDVL